MAKKRSREDVEFVECGRVGRVVGLRGECSVFWNSGECPVEVGGELFLSNGEVKYKSVKVAALRKQGRSCVVRFDGICSRDEAALLRGSVLHIPADRLESLPEGEYYSYQILGIEVITEAGRKLGKIVRIFTAGENDVYEILPDGGKSGEEILIPATAEVVKSVDVESKRMIIAPIDGMLG